MMRSVLSLCRNRQEMASFFSNFKVSVNKSFVLRMLGIICIIWSIIIVQHSTSFATSATDDPIGDRLCNIVRTLSGNVAKSISIIALFVIGVGLFAGKVNWSIALTTAAGIVMIFSAPKIITWVAGGKVDTSSCADAMLSK